jgi:hypothetical protein
MFDFLNEKKYAGFVCTNRMSHVRCTLYGIDPLVRSLKEDEFCY